MKRCFLCKEPCSSLNKRSFHRFPKDYSMKMKWLNILNLPLNFQVKSQLICSDHFSENSFFSYVEGQSGSRLQAGAVPLAFNKATQHVLSENNVNNESTELLITVKCEDFSSVTSEQSYTEPSNIYLKDAGSTEISSPIGVLENCTLSTSTTDTCSSKQSTQHSAYTEAQLGVIIEFMHENRKIAKGEYVGLEGLRANWANWKRLRFLLKGCGPDKSVDQWQVIWADIKKEAREEHKKYLNNIAKNGRDDVKPLSAFDQTIISMVGSEDTPSNNESLLSTTNKSESSNSSLNDSSHSSQTEYMNATLDSKISIKSEPNLCEDSNNKQTPLPQSDDLNTTQMEYVNETPDFEISIKSEPNWCDDSNNKQTPLTHPDDFYHSTQVEYVNATDLQISIKSEPNWDEDSNNKKTPLPQSSTKINTSQASSEPLQNEDAREMLQDIFYQFKIQNQLMAVQTRRQHFKRMQNRRFYFKF